MGLSFGNPLGFLALLGIPAVILIHFLQRRSRPLRVSTLFLLEQLQRESEGGPRFERLRSSIPLWLQLLAVLILTWLLTEPRWLEKNSAQRIVVVLDGSASMSVSRARVEQRLPQALQRLASAAAHTEFYLLDSRRDSGHLYHGGSIDELLASAAKWQPSGGTHDPAPALRLARSLGGREGTVIYVTDHVSQDLLWGARLFAAGAPEPNAGIAGVTVEEKDGRTVWRAMVRNYGTEPLTREWWTTSGAAVSPRQSLTIPPGGTQSLQGAFAENQHEFTLHLTPDKFSADDTGAVLRPRPRQLQIFLPAGEESQPQESRLYTSLFKSFPEVVITADAAAADAVVAHYDPLDPALPQKPACLFVKDPRPEAPTLGGTLLVEAHPYTDGLNWQSLLVEDAISIPPQAQDETIVWLGERPLLFLRGPDTRRILCFNFDLQKSNARRLPAMVVTLHRFLDDVRRQIRREEWANVECGQRLQCPVKTAPGSSQVQYTWTDAATGQETKAALPPGQAAALLTAPPVAAILTVHQDDQLLLKAAAHFADVREADFSQAASKEDLDGVQATLVERHSRADGAWRFWLLILLAALAAAWWFIHQPLGRRKQRLATDPAVS